MSPSPQELDKTPGLTELRQQNREAQEEINRRLNLLLRHKPEYVLRGFVFDREKGTLYIHPIYQGENQKLIALGGTGFDREFEVYPTKVTDTNVAWGPDCKKAYPWSDTTYRLCLDENGRLGLRFPDAPSTIEAVVLMKDYDGVNLIDQLTTDETGRSTLATEIDRQSLISQLQNGLESASGRSIEEL